MRGRPRTRRRRFKDIIYIYEYIRNNNRMLPIRYTSIASMRQWAVMADVCQAGRPMLRSFPCSVPEEHHPLLGRPDRYGPSALHVLQLRRKYSGRDSISSNPQFGSSLLWLCTIIPAAIGFFAMAGPIISTTKDLLSDLSLLFLLLLLQNHSSPPVPPLRPQSGPVRYKKTARTDSSDGTLPDYM